MDKARQRCMLLVGFYFGVDEMSRESLTVNFKLPEYTKTFKGDACLNKKEVMSILGYKTEEGFRKAIVSGIFPDADKESFRIVNKASPPKKMWSICLLRKVERGEWTSA